MQSFAHVKDVVKAPCYMLNFENVSVATSHLRQSRGEKHTLSHMFGKVQKKENWGKKTPSLSTSSAYQRVKSIIVTWKHTLNPMERIKVNKGYYSPGLAQVIAK